MRIGVVTDIHIAPEGTGVGKWINPLHYHRAPALLKQVTAWFEDQSLDAVAVLGDLANFGDDASIQKGIALLNELSVPVLLISGNHDTVVTVDSWRNAVLASASTHVAIAGGTPVTTFSVPVVAASDVLVTPNAQPEEWRYPANHLQADSAGLLLALMHFPLLIRAEEINAAGLPYAAGFDLESTGEALRNRTDPTIVLHGHLHVRHSVIEGPVLQLGFASLIEPPHNASVVEIITTDDQVRVSVEHHQVLESTVERVPVLSPDSENFRWSGADWTRE